MILIGKIVNTKGLNGEVKILSSSDFKNERFKKGKKLFINVNNEYKELIIKNAYNYKNFEIVKFEGLNSINEVEKLKNQKIYSEALNREVLQEGEYFFSDLINLEVVEEKEIGAVVEVLDYGNKTYLKIKKKNGKNILFPFNEKFITNVDLENGIINIKTIDGLLDD